jgi:hypothetical protein
MYAKIENNTVVSYPLGEADIKALFPNTSFTTDFASGLPDGFVRVLPHGHSYNVDAQNVIEGTPQLVDGQWLQSWIATDKYTAEELAQQVVNATTQKWENLRADRNEKLTNSDWTQLTDTNVDKTAWTIYRQALRDFPANVTDIDNLTWPTQPS